MLIAGDIGGTKNRSGNLDKRSRVFAAAGVKMFENRVNQVHHIFNNLADPPHPAWPEIGRKS